MKRIIWEIKTAADSEAPGGHDIAMWKKRSELPAGLAGKCYRCRDYPENTIRLLQAENGTKILCLYISDNNPDKVMACIKEIRIDDSNQPDEYIMIREIKGDIAYAYDRITDE